MKVALIAPGPEDHAISCANGLAQHADVLMAVPKRFYGDLQEWIDPAVDLRMLDWPRTLSLANVRLLWDLTRQLRQWQPDVIHILSNTTVWLNAALPFLRAVAPVVVTVHDVTVHPGDHDTKRLPDWGARMMARGAGDLVVHGANLRRAAMQRFDRPVDRVHIVPHPAISRYADLAQREGFAPAPPNGQFRLLMFGRMFHYKGVIDLIRAEALLGDRVPDLTITLAGRGDDAWVMRALMGDPDRYDVRHRFIPDAEVAQLFLDADAVVLPYSEASQSGVLFVAATFGKPVIVTNVGDLGPTVHKSGIGLVVPPEDADALANAIEQLWRDPDLCRTLGDCAANWAANTVSGAAVGAESVGLYERILQKANTPVRKHTSGIGRPN